ncbi:MAG: hypothetical protein HFP76_07755 [Methylococcales symbiont of Iophon sp. n. MRB-2018]|nr:MAG: hypothetical protein HFP76_07755 [Methylococcales symbiont of Iophon sp. n. MRB-2018]
MAYVLNCTLISQSLKTQTKKYIKRTQDSRLKTQDSRLKTQDSRLKTKD